MRRLSITLLLFCILANCFGQKPKKITAYLSGQYTNTLHDFTKENNPWGIGLDLQVIGYPQGIISPIVEVSFDRYLMSYKVLKVYADGTPVPSVSQMTNVLAGISVNLPANIYVSAAAGPSFIDGEAFFGIKPSVGVFLSSSKRWNVRVSYIHIYKREKRFEKDFTSLSYSLGIRLF